VGVVVAVAVVGGAYDIGCFPCARELGGGFVDIFSFVAARAAGMAFAVRGSGGFINSPPVLPLPFSSADPVAEPADCTPCPGNTEFSALAAGIITLETFLFFLQDTNCSTDAAGIGTASIDNLVLKSADDRPLCKTVSS
jgi:hypothetical protein